jgi:hypothetical protein
VAVANIWYKQGMSVRLVFKVGPYPCPRVVIISSVLVLGAFASTITTN